MGYGPSVIPVMTGDGGVDVIIGIGDGMKYVGGVLVITGEGKGKFVIMGMGIVCAAETE